MPDTGYLLAVLAIVFSITFALRAVPFAVLKPLRRSHLVRTLAVWMPGGILAILAATSLHTSIDDDGAALYALIAVAATAAVHLGFGRRTLLSVGIGTGVYVVLLNLL
ncbi:branched-chain amino acid transporter AzlD [Nocardia cyriacigeorgica]|uniref:Branched-chain amino acid transporter AzlD n=1 Tax=Nocardia cyriacigeorgica TaxID=135487 RepID=A0ABX0CLU0_9NOCA|nr:AzlD domain-containing protein [Nocardia cyriacigeorgica]NEW40989.1 branched-chain amino acid transporter AzlD [Nocardia cyriacigeorgica]NEW51205.1 branched-chain amino acid transporter AzlD [Nocardia cyriacigeorgica]NEW55275.1 branched-chain amino acid transporter AzlD [Nocardia cyriacigeorgica]